MEQKENKETNYLHLNGKDYIAVGGTEGSCHGCVFNYNDACGLISGSGFGCNNNSILKEYHRPISFKDGANDAKVDVFQDGTASINGEVYVKVPNSGKDNDNGTKASNGLNMGCDPDSFVTDKIQAPNVVKVGGIHKQSYYAFPNGVEAEDICRYLPFNLGSVLKYICRAGRKAGNDAVTDLNKALDYLKNQIELEKEKGNKG